MASITKTQTNTGETRYRVRWKEREVLVAPGGKTVERWRSKERSVKTLKDAKALVLRVESANAVGDRYVPEQEQPVTTLKVAVDAYMTRAGNEQTSRYRRSLLSRFTSWTGSPTTIEGLTSGTLLSYATYLREEGIKSVHRYVLQVEQLWAWVYKHRDTYPGASEPVSIATGQDREVAPAPLPPVAINPTWADIDAMLHALTEDGAIVNGSGSGYRPQWELYRRIALVQRYTGLRISQVCGIRRSDLDLDAGSLWLRRRRGSKGRGDRMVPLHPALVASIKESEQDQNVDTDLLFFRVATKGARKGKVIEVSQDDCRLPFARAWERAEVDRAKWGDVGRDKGRPTHAIRATWKSAITGAAGYELAALMVGQAAGRSDHDAYVSAGASSPYWEKMVEALESIPVIDDHDEE